MNIWQRPRQKKPYNSSKWALVVAAGFQFACSVDSAKNHYVLAEKLWAEGNYSASVSEFEKVISKDQKTIGYQALYRAASTQLLFLSQYEAAKEKFSRIIELNIDPKMTWQARLQIGDILFSKLEQYGQAILFYSELTKMKPDHEMVPEWMFRVAKSHFYLLQFEEAAQAFRELKTKFPLSLWGERASFEIGQTYLAQGEKSLDSHSSSSEQIRNRAIGAFREFLKKYPRSSLRAQAEFGVASCIEAGDQLQEAYQAFSDLKQRYPVPGVVEIKLSRIRERISQKGRKK